VLKNKLLSSVELWLSRRGKWIIFIIWLAVLVVFLSLSSDELGGSLGGDNAHYIMLARSLALGKGYRDLFLPGEPPHTKYPFLFPLMLSAFARSSRPVFYSHIWVAIISSLIPLVGLGWARLEGKSRVQSLLLFILLVSLPFLFFVALNILSEALFIFWLVLILFWIAYLRVKGLNPFRLIFLGICLILEYYTRSAGLVIGGAVIVVFILEKEFRQKRFFRLPAWGWLAIIFFLGIIPWQIRGAVYGAPYFHQFLLKDNYNPDLGYVGLMDLVLRFKNNCQFYLLALGDFFYSRAVSLSLEKYLGTVSLLISLIGLVGEIWRKKFSSAVIFISYFLFIMLWPFQEIRFISPLYILVGYFFLRGLEIIFQKFSLKIKELIPSLILIIIISWQIKFMSDKLKYFHTPQYFPQEAVYVWGYHKLEEPVIDFSKYPGYWGMSKSYKRRWAHLIIMMKIAGEKLPQSAIILSRTNRITWYYSQRKSIRMLFTADHKKQWNYIFKNNVKYILYDPYYAYLFSFLRESPRKIKVLYLTDIKVALLEITDQPVEGK